MQNTNSHLNWDVLKCHNVSDFCQLLLGFITITTVILLVFLVFSPAACLCKYGSWWRSHLGVYESAGPARVCLLWHTLESSNWSCHTKLKPDGKCSEGTFLSVTMAADSRGKSTFDCSRWQDLCLSWPDQNWNCHRLINTCKGSLWSWETSLWQDAIPAAACKLKYS